MLKKMNFIVGVMDGINLSFWRQIVKRNKGVGMFTKSKGEYYKKENKLNWHLNKAKYHRRIRKKYKKRLGDNND